MVERYFKHVSVPWWWLSSLTRSGLLTPWTPWSMGTPLLATPTICTGTHVSTWKVGGHNFQLCQTPDLFDTDEGWFYDIFKQYLIIQFFVDLFLFKVPNTIPLILPHWPLIVIYFISQLQPKRATTIGRTGSWWSTPLSKGSLTQK